MDIYVAVVTVEGQEKNATTLPMACENFYELGRRVQEMGFVHAVGNNPYLYKKRDLHGRLVRVMLTKVNVIEGISI